MGTKSPRSELLAVQKGLWRANRRMIEGSIRVREPGFASYERGYRRAAADYQRVSDEDEMVRSCLDSDIIYVGDYHTCNQSQRSFLRILKAVIRKDRRFTVGMELIHKRHQKVLDDYLKGRLREKNFLRKIRLQEHWVFDLWENFHPIFEFCKYHCIPILAIDCALAGSGVQKRDRASAKLLAKEIEKNPDRRMFVFIGDLHIAPPHLPRDVEEELQKHGIKKRRVILYQNSERIYWKLAEEGVDDYVEVVKLKSGDYCRAHTPPVVCQRSYLNWLEHDEGEIDYSDAKTSFLELVDRMCDFLKLSVGRARDEVEVFTAGDLSFLRHLRGKGHFSKREISIIKRQILASESYYIAKAKVVYLANLSVNHAAEEAAHFIKGVCSGVEKPRELVDAFYANILHEALGFFGSKMINHKRKCCHEKEFKKLLAYFQTARIPKERRLESETAKAVLEYKALEKKGGVLPHADIFHSRLDLFLSITHALGYMLGDRMYYGLVSRKISKRDAARLFTDPWEIRGEPVRVYRELLSQLRGVKLPRRM